MFLNPLMLAGLGAAALPLVLHLLARARYRTVDFGATMFLADAGARRDGGARLREAALLIARCAIVAGLALALARPVARRGWSMLAEPARVTAVILLDRSASTAYEDNGRTRLDDAKRAALNL